MRFFGKKDTQVAGGAADETAEAEEQPKASFFDRMKQAVSRTRESLGSRIEGIVALTRTVDEGALEELETALLTSDLGVQTTTAILDGLRERAKRKAIEGGCGVAGSAEGRVERDAGAADRRASRGEAARGWAAGDFSGGRERDGQDDFGGQAGGVVSRAGAGRCCCARRIRFARRRLSSLRCGQARSGVEMIKTKQGGDPAAVLYDAAAAAKAHGTAVLLVDTAGRLHTKTGLMDELDKMRRTAARLIPGAPHEVLLVMDATTGQNGLQQARLFTQAARCDGDCVDQAGWDGEGRHCCGDCAELGMPVRFVGVGEQMEDLLEFDAGAFVDSLLGNER